MLIYLLFADVRRLALSALSLIRLLLCADWSPEQIANVLTKAGASVSNEWIYRYVALDKCQAGKLYRHLRQGRKRYRKGGNVKAPTIKNAISIDERPLIVNSRERFGDWEIDTVLGKYGSGAVVAILERKSRFYLAKKVLSKSAEEVTKATIEMLMPYKEHVHTIMVESLRAIGKSQKHWKQSFTLLIHIVLGSEVRTRMPC